MSQDRPCKSTSFCTLCPFQPVCRHARGGATSGRQQWLTPDRRYLQAGETLYAQGRPALAAYPVHEGGLKQVYESQLGWHQVSGFLQPGDVAGLESSEAATDAATGVATYRASAIALQDTECCAIPVEALRAQMADPAFRGAILAILRRQAERQSELLVAIGSMKAAQRLAMLLLDLAAEQARRGMTDDALTLAMTRNDIASYLGLTLETVSRLLSRFGANGLIHVRHRQLRIVDRAGLAAVRADPEQIALRGAGRSESQRLATVQRRL
nr:Crp/Fnr family transcriptional regulator [uncultured Cupriavidus sp.]